MKTLVTFSIFSPSWDAAAVEKLTTFHQAQVDLKQYATYTVEGGVATITAIEPIFRTVIGLPLPFTIPVDDLGSGVLTHVDVNADSLKALPSVCPRQSWADRRQQQPALTIPQQLIADHCGLY